MNNIKTNPTYKALVKKVDGNGKMPSIAKISELLTLAGVKHSFDGEVVNVVEYRNAGSRVVNSRHDGKVGKKIEFRANVKKGKVSPFKMFGVSDDSKHFGLDSSSSYYTWNTWSYANELVTLLNNVNLFTFTNR